MNNDPRHISDLIRDRQALAAKLADLNRQVAELDAEIFAKAELFSRAADALSALGLAQPQQQTLPIPPRPVVAPPPAPRPPMLPTVSPPVAPPLPSSGRAPYIAVVENVALPPPRIGSVGPAILEGTRRILREAGHPLKIRDIYEVLIKRGVHIPGKQPASNLSAHLSRSNEFALLGGNRWWFAEKQKAP